MFELLQFRHSPYNEKVRWALDLECVPHVRRSLLPGLHLPSVRRVTGQTATPVLAVNSSEAIDGSARTGCAIYARHRLSQADLDGPGAAGAAATSNWHVVYLHNMPARKAASVMGN